MPRSALVACVLLPFLLGLLCGCAGQNDLFFSIRFDHGKGLAAGDLLFHQGAAVGRVLEVRSQDSAGIVAEVKVFEEFRDLLVEGSTFAVTRSLPGISSRPRIEITIVDPSSKPLRKGFEARGGAASPGHSAK